MQVEQVTDPVTYHGEGPVWSARCGGLRWVDVLPGDVLSLEDDGRRSAGAGTRGMIGVVLPSAAACHRPW